VTHEERAALIMTLWVSLRRLVPPRSLDAFTELQHAITVVHNEHTAANWQAGHQTGVTQATPADARTYRQGFADGMIAESSRIDRRDEGCPVEPVELQHVH
jgi:hypothetical protein